MKIAELPNKVRPNDLCIVESVGKFHVEIFQYGVVKKRWPRSDQYGYTWRPLSINGGTGHIAPARFESLKEARVFAKMIIRGTIIHKVA